MKINPLYRRSVRTIVTIILPLALVLSACSSGSSSQSNGPIIGATQVGPAVSGAATDVSGANQAGGGAGTQAAYPAPAQGSGVNPAATAAANNPSSYPAPGQAQTPQALLPAGTAYPEPSGANTATPPAQQPTSQAQGMMPNPCEVVTKADAQAALGQPVSDGVEKTDTLMGMQGSACTYVAANGNQTQRVLVVLTRYSDNAQALQVYSTAMQGAQAAKTQFNKITDLGDAAFTAPWSVLVLKGNTLMAIELITSLQSNDPTTAVDLARVAVKRLQ